jgi:hypothetical protein
MKRLLGALAVALTLAVAGAAPALADGADDLCQGEPSCTVVDPGTGLDLGPDLGPDPTGIPGWFVGLFVLAAIAGVAATVYRVSAARQMARRAGLDENAATTVALLDDNGLSAAYVASSLRPAPADAPATQTPRRPAAERLAELQALKDAGAITETEYAARRQAIIDSI